MNNRNFLIYKYDYNKHEDEEEKGFNIQCMEICTLKDFYCAVEKDQTFLEELFRTYGRIVWFQFLVFCTSSMRVLLYSAICLDTFFIIGL